MMLPSLTAFTFYSQGEKFIYKYVIPPFSSVLAHFLLCLLSFSSGSRKAISSAEGVKYITPEKSKPDLKAVPVTLILISALFPV